MLSDVFVGECNLHIVLLFHLDLPCKGLFLTFHSIIHLSLDNIDIKFEIETYDPFNFILFQECFGYSGSLVFPYAF